jgi:hypothetical protein
MGPGDVAAVRCAEAVVNRVALKYVDAKTGEARDEGRTRPEVVLRQLATRPGRVYSLKQAKVSAAFVLVFRHLSSISTPRPFACHSR